MLIATQVASTFRKFLAPVMHLGVSVARKFPDNPFEAAIRRKSYLTALEIASKIIDEEAKWLILLNETNDVYEMVHAMIVARLEKFQYFNINDTAWQLLYCHLEVIYSETGPQRMGSSLAYLAFLAHAFRQFAMECPTKAQDKSEAWERTKPLIDGVFDNFTRLRSYRYPKFVTSFGGKPSVTTMSLWEREMIRHATDCSPYMGCGHSKEVVRS
jgi:hypothetical protein